MGATAIYCQETLKKEIVDRLALGESLRKICLTDGFPTASAVCKWQDEDKEFDTQVARARILGHDALAEECITIADDQSDEPASRRVRVETRLKILACISTKYRADAPAPTVNVGVQVTNVLTDERRAELVARRRAALGLPPPQTAEGA